MPIYTLQGPDGRTYEIEGPAGATADQLGAVISQLQPQAQPKPKLDAVEAPNWFERQLAKLPDIVSPKTESQLRGFAMGAADPFVGTAQLLANALRQGEGINKAVATKEAEYQAGRKGSGREGLDVSRLAGNLAITAPIPAGKIAPTLGGKVLQGAATGAAYGAAQPVTEGDFWNEKLKQAGTGAAGGAVAAPVASGLARVLSPKASERIAGMREEGIQPTIGQALGGAIGRTEEKMQSLPIVGDAIMAARQSARDQFNKATINKALAPIGEKVDDIGQEGIRQAGDKLSKAFDDALAQVKGIKLDQQFGDDLANLRNLASGLDPKFQTKLESLIQDKVIGKASPNGGMVGENFQKVISDLGGEARTFSGMQNFGARDYSNAVKELQNILQSTAERTSSPESQAALKAAREGWANLVRIEGAGTAAKANEGVFTPGQLLNAVRRGDTSVRDRSTARGTALLQDWATQGQKVLGDKYPDSGTAGRLAAGIGGLASGAINPAIPAALVGGAAAYMSPIQRAMVSAVADRPQIAKKLAEILRKSPSLALPGAAVSQSLVNSR